MATAATIRTAGTKRAEILEVFYRYMGNEEQLVPSPPLSPGESQAHILTAFSGDMSPQSSAPEALSLNDILSQLQNHPDSHPLTERQKEQACLVADRLRVLGDEINIKLCSQNFWSVLMSGFRNPDSSILKQFENAIQAAKNELSCRVVVRVFYVGFCLFQSVAPKAPVYDEQHRALLGVFINFLTEELAEWVEDQGGWSHVLSEDNHMRSQSVPVLTDSDSLGSDSPLQSSTRRHAPYDSPVSRGTRSASVSNPIPISPPPRPSNLPQRNSYGFQSIQEDDSPSLCRRNSLRLATIGAISFSIALGSFLFSGHS
jgi:hypothetical protein